MVLKIVCGSFLHKRKTILKHIFEIKNVTLTRQINSSFIFLALTHSVIEHLEKPNSYARALFIDFSSAFNTILPTLLIEQLASSGVSSTLRKFILDFLTGRHQRVRVGHHLSSFIIINTGAPQGCVLSAYLFIIYTNLLRSLFPNCRVYKYADDTVIIGLVSNNNETDYRKQIELSTKWCTEYNMLLNVNKTKELVFDFRRNRLDITPVVIDNSPVDICQQVKYLGVIIDDRLNWTSHIDYVVSKCHQRMYFLRLLSSFNVSSTILRTFYHSFIESVVSYNIVLWWNSACVKDRTRLSRITKHARRIIPDVNTMDNIYESMVIKKVNNIIRLDDELSRYYITMRSGSRYRAPNCRTQRYRKSFVPNSVHIMNS